MTIDNLLALVGFAFVMSASPGPGNFLLLASSANFGFARSIPLVLGISSGFLSMVFLVGVGLGEVFQHYPFIYRTLKYTCTCYVLWLSWKIASNRTTSTGNRKEISIPIGFPQAALFQLVNPKAWAVALIVTTTYTNPTNYLPSLLLMITVFAVINIPTISLWALCGTFLMKFLGTGRRIKIFNIAMAILLITSILPVLFDFND